MPVALITGASRGIGAHLTRALAGAGWQVAALARNAELVQQVADEADDDAARPGPTTGLGDRSPEQPRVLPLVCDVTDTDQVEAAVDRTLETFGRIDLLINNAGLNHTEAHLWDTDPEQWWQVLTVNVKGPYLLTRAVVPRMIAAGGGRIINLNSGSGTRDNAESSGYNASKSALFRITGATALAGAEHGVYAFDLAPGVVRTDMTAVMRAHADRTEWTSPEQVAEMVLALAGGDLDAYSGRMVRAGGDTPEQLRARASSLPQEARRLRLVPWGADDPIA